MFEKIKGFVKKVSEKIKEKITEVETNVTAAAHVALAGTRAEAYVDSGVKIIIAVVIGALLLGLVYVLFNETIRTSVTNKVNELFNYGGGGGA